MNNNAPSIYDVLQVELSRHGLVAPPQDRITPGKFTRFPGAGKDRNNRAGWLQIFPDERGAVFGDYSQDIKGHCFVSQNPSHQDRAAAAAARAKAEEQRKEEAERAAQEAAQIWEAGSEADPRHPYLSSKRISALGVKQNQQGDLMVPAQDTQGRIRSIQRITSSGQKRFLPGGLKQGYFCLLPVATTEIEEDTILICEGYATGATLRAATGCPVVVGFDSGNLMPVASAIRNSYPNHKIVICADDDWRTTGNPGVTAATAAAQYIGAHLAIPDFSSVDHRPEKATDYNDLDGLTGGHAVLHSIQNALKKPPPAKAEQGRDSESDADQEVKIDMLDMAGKVIGVCPPPVPMLIDPIAPKAGAIEFYGPPGCCKTHLIGSIAMAIATGSNSWFGLPVVQREGNIYLITDEIGDEDGAARLLNRVSDYRGPYPNRMKIIKARGQTLATLGTRLHLSDDNYQGKLRKLIWTPFGAAVKKMIESDPGGVALVIFDSLTALITGMAGPNQEESIVVSTALDRWARDIDICLIGTAHVSQDSMLNQKLPCRLSYTSRTGSNGTAGGYYAMLGVSSINIKDLDGKSGAPTQAACLAARVDPAKHKLVCLAQSKVRDGREVYDPYHPMLFVQNQEGHLELAARRINLVPDHHPDKKNGGKTTILPTPSHNQTVELEAIYG